MERVDVTLKLPQQLAEEAKSAGLLEAEQIERLLTSELNRQKRVNRFLGKLDQLTAVEPPLTPEEIEAEIKAHRR